MSEEVSNQIRVGITVILVAALVAAVLNLMVISQSILGSGMGTLQSGVDQVGMQEFENYNQKKVSGTVVKSALSLYEGRDVAIVIRTMSCINNESSGVWAYNYGSVLEGSQSKNLAADNLISVRNTALTRKAGNSFYTCNLKLTNGVISVNNNTKGVTTTGDPQFVLESARFRGELIKDSTGAIVGVLFTQLK